MDPALIGAIGVIAGAVLTFLGGIGGKLVEYQFEKKRWERQQEAERLKKEKESETEYREYLREVYHNCIRGLSTLNQADTGNFRLDDRAKVLQETLDWLALLIIHQRSEYKNTESRFYSDYQFFERNSVNFSGRLLGTIINLAHDDKQVYPHLTGEEEKEALLEDRKVSVSIDHKFRSKGFVDGIDIPPLFTLTYHISDLKPSQRKKLLETGFGLIDNKNQNTQLFLPVHDAQKNIRHRGREWNAKLNPLEVSISDVFHAWEQAYDEALSKLTADQK